jgi:hypothetical protein
MTHFNTAKAQNLEQQKNRTAVGMLMYTLALQKLWKSFI